MLCPPTYGTRWAAYRRLSRVLIELQVYRVATLAESNFAPMALTILSNRSGGGVVAFHRRSRPLMFVYDNYSGTNGRLTPFVGVDSNAISVYLGSSADATPAKSRDVTAFANWKFEYREMTSQTKPKICYVSYSRLRNMPQTTWWWNV